MEVHAIDTLSGREEPLEIDADATVSAMKRQCGEAFGFGEDVELSVSGQRVACDGAERISNVAAFSGGCRVGVVRGVAEFVAQLHSGAVKMDDIPVWARQRRECVLAMLACAQKAKKQCPQMIQAHWVHPSLHDDKEVMLQYVKYNPKAVVRASAALRSDADIVMAALKHNASLWYNVEDKSLQNQRSVAGRAVPHCANSAVWLSDKAFVLEALEKRAVWPFVSKALQQDKEVAMKALLHNKVYFGDLSETLRGGKDFVMKALPQGYAHFSDLSGALKQDKEVVMEALRHHMLGGFHQLNATLQQDKEVAMEALRMKNVNFGDLSEALRGDKEFVMEAPDSCLPANFSDLSGGLKQDNEGAMKVHHRNDQSQEDDKDIAMKEIRTYCLEDMELRPPAFGDLSEEMRGDKEVVMRALRGATRGDFHKLSPALQQDKEVVMCHFETVDKFLQLSATLQQDKDVVMVALKCVERIGRARLNFGDLSEAMRGDKEVVMKALEKCRMVRNFRQLSLTLQEDKEVVLKALRKKKVKLGDLGEALQADKAFVMQAIASRPSQYVHIAGPLRNDKDIVLAAIASKSSLFMRMVPALRDDLDVALPAIRDDPNNFIYAGDSVRADKQAALAAFYNTQGRIPAEDDEDDLVLLANRHVRNHPVLIPFVSAELQADREVVLAAVRANAKNGEYTSKTCLPLARRAPPLC